MSEPGGDPSSGISSGDALILPERHPACSRREARPGFRMERENLCFVTSEDVKGQAASGSNREGESTEAGRRGGAARSSVEGPVMGLERRGRVVRPWPLANWKQEEPVDEAKPFRQRSNIGSRVTREGHARFWERPEVKFLRATRQGRRSRGAVKGSALPQKADQPLLQSIMCSVPDSDVAGPKILAYSRVRSVAAVRSLQRAVWSTLGLAGEQAWICAIVTTFMIFGVWPSGECPVRSSIISTAPRTRRQRTGATRKPSKAATLYPASCAGLGALIFQSPPWARSSRCRSIALPLPCSACSTIRVNVPSRPRLRNMARCSACLR